MQNEVAVMLGEKLIDGGLGKYSESVKLSPSNFINKLCVYPNNYVRTWVLATHQ